MVQGPYHEGMATVTYNRVKRIFTVIWKDYKKEALGAKYPYGRKSRKWQGEKAPSSAERKQIEKELLDFATKAEYQSKEQAQYIRVYGNDEAIQASAYLNALTDDELTITDNKTTKRKARNIVKAFSSWLDENYKSIELHRIDEEIAVKYYKHLKKQGITYATIRTYIIRLSYIFKRVIRKYKKGTLKYENPFSTLPLNEVIDKVASHKRKPYENSHLEQFLLSATYSKRLNKWQTLQRFAIYYFLIVTGWRVNDILRLKWQNIDLQKGIIKLTHSKTKKQGITTELMMTEYMELILHGLKIMTDTISKSHKEFVFSLRGDEASMTSTQYQSIEEHFTKVREKLGLTEHTQKGKIKTYSYNIHAFRKTVITKLTQDGFQEAIINYLVGHAPRTTEEKSYLSLSARDTLKLILHMEGLSKVHIYMKKIEVIKNLIDARQKEIDDFVSELEAGTWPKTEKPL